MTRFTTVVAIGMCENGHKIRTEGNGREDRPGKATFGSAHDICDECGSSVIITEYQDLGPDGPPVRIADEDVIAAIDSWDGKNSNEPLVTLLNSITDIDEISRVEGLILNHQKTH